MKNLFYVFSVSFLKKQFANKLFAFLLFLFLLLPQYACNTTEPPNNQTLSLKLEDVSCTEALLQLTSTNIQIPNNITFYINNKPQKTINLTTADTLLYIDSLLPNQNYSFQVSSIQNQESSILSNELNVTTMDTTSHNFTWQTFTFGQHSSSVLYDVAIINENDIWAVGEIYMNDSLGNPDPACYNAVHWDGQRWELIKTGGYGGYPRRTVFAFSENDVWFDGVIKWDGVNYTVHMNGWPLMPNGDGWQVNKMWGSSSNDIYAVGANGNIAHYQNGSWTKIESGTTTDILDIWGYTDSFTSNISVYCAVSYVFQNGDRKILRIKNNKVDSLSWLNDTRVNSVWTPNNYVFYTAGGGVYEYKNSSWNQVIGLPPYYSDNIRGNDLNDIFVCGDFGMLSHFNGLSWQTYNEHYLQGILFSVTTKNNNVVTVGLKGSKAIIITGKRN